MIYFYTIKHSITLKNMNANNRNSFGFKDSINCYLTIAGKQWNQMTDFRLNRETNEMSDLSKENSSQEIADLEKEYPAMMFKCRKVSGLYRIYSTLK